LSEKIRLRDSRRLNNDFGPVRQPHRFGTRTATLILAGQYEQIKNNPLAQTF
jgi:hypothetical protein